MNTHETQPSGQGPHPFPTKWYLVLHNVHILGLVHWSQPNGHPKQSPSESLIDYGLQSIHFKVFSSHLLQFGGHDIQRPIVDESIYPTSH